MEGLVDGFTKGFMLAFEYWYISIPLVIFATFAKDKPKQEVLGTQNIEDIVTWQVVGTEQRGVNPIWWFFWLIVFFPFLVFVFFIHNQKVELVQLTYKNGDSSSIKLVKEEANKFIKKMNKVGASQVKESTKVCPFCAETIQSKAILCRYCHQKLDNSSTQKFLTNKQHTKV